MTPQIATMMFQVHHGLSPEHLTGMFIKCSQSTSYGLRSTNVLDECPKKSFSYKGAYLWNLLSKDAKIASSLHSLKAALRPSDFFS